MSIHNIVKKLEGCRNSDNSKIMYRAIEVTLCASEFTNDSRLKSYMDLLNLCTKERNEDVIDFTRAVIATHYYFSVDRGLRAVPFLNESLQKYGKLSGVEPPSVDDADRFAGNFRALNLCHKFQREKKAVRNILVLHQAACNMNIDLNLDELVLDYIPECYVWDGFLASLALVLAGVALVLCQFEEYRIERLSGGYMPFFDALQPGEIPLVVFGISIAFMAGWYTLMKGTPTHVSLMSRYYYWRFIKENP